MPNMTVEEIDAEISKLQQQRVEQERVEAEANRAKYLEEARQLIGELRTNLDRLYELGYVPPKLLEALTSNGKWNPGMFIKTPRAAGGSNTA